MEKLSKQFFAICALVFASTGIFANDISKTDQAQQQSLQYLLESGEQKNDCVAATLNTAFIDQELSMTPECRYLTKCCEGDTPNKNKCCQGVLAKCKDGPNQ